jgi:hypothetical protein
MLKFKIGGRLQNILYLSGRTFGYWCEALFFSLIAVAFYIIGNIFFSGRLIRDVRLPLFLLGPDIVSIWAISGLIPLTQFI